jgi:pyruvate dehydrogenase E2 component (dihydrolipoamide acetyltransferase)
MMPTPIRVPNLGTATDEITLLEWVVSEGDEVNRGDIICEMETDKAVIQLECVAAGILLKHVVAAGTLIEEGTVIAYVGAAGEEAPPQEEMVALPEQVASADEEKSGATSPSAVAHPAIKASPVVRNLAAKMGVDLTHVKGTGPGGLITREDVQKATKSGA